MFMETTKNKKILSGIFIVLVLAVAFYFMYNKNKKSITVNSDAVSTTTVGGTNTKVLGSGDYTITQVPIENKKRVPAPDLNRVVVFGKTVNLTEEVKKIVTDKITTLQSDLKKDNTNLNNWLSLGLYQKMAGDYEGAVITWKYVGEVANKDFISFGNLGDLYGYYLHDNAMAEMYYKKAIANAPTQSYLYVQLAMLYKDVFNDLDKARAVIVDGLKKLPDNQSLIETRDNMLK